MARKPNYGLNKHLKEQGRRAKKEAKLLERQNRRDEQAKTDTDQADGASPGSENAGPETS